MFRICKIIELESGHLLSKHPGSCQFPHGHTRSVELVFAAETLDENDMVMDFKKLKAVLQEESVSPCDHAFLYDTTSDVECDIAQTLQKHGLRTYPLAYRSTSENLARHFYDKIAQRGLPVTAVSISETPESCATYRK